MPSQSVGSSTPTEIITSSMVNRIRSGQGPPHGVSVAVEGSNDIRIVPDQRKEHARDGEPLQVGDVLDMVPSEAHYAIAESGTATVHVNFMYYRPVDRRSP